MAIIGRPVYSDELLHYQVKGAKWGVRRWQNLDGIGPARDKDPDLVDPVKTANADVERLNKAGVAFREAEGRRYAREKELKKGRKWLSFESKKSWEARKKSLQDQIAKESADEKKYNAEMNAARDVAQARFEKYMKIQDELTSDLDWIDMHMYLETGEAGSKQTYKDRDEMERQWSVLEDALDKYWYGSGFVDHEGALYANAEYRDKFEMNDNPRGKEAAKEQSVKFALRNAKLPKTGREAYDSIAKDIAKGKLLDSNEILKALTLRL